MAKHKIGFTTKDSDGNDLALAVRMPTSAERTSARFAHAKTWGDAVKKGVLMRAAVGDHLKANGLWSDEKDAEIDQINKDINAGLLKLKKGGISKKVARDLALSILDLRRQRLGLREVYNAADAQSAESIADQVQFDTLVAACVVYDGDGPNAGTKYFASYDAMVESKEQIATVDATNKFAELFYGYTDEEVKDDPEVKFLKDYGFADKDGNLTRPEDGKKVDREWRLINDDGRYVDEAGNLVDRDGNPVDEDGEPIVEFTPFLD